MKKLDRYFFPAIFSQNEGEEISVVFPDLNCATSGIDDQDALLSARDLLGAVLYGLEEDGEKIPQPTKLINLKLKDNQKALLVDVFMPSVRMLNINKSVNRTVTLPSWLNALAIEHNINFSGLLQKAIKSELKL